MTNPGKKISIEEYLAKISVFADDRYGQCIRERFKDIRGSSELAMLETPSGEELAQLQKAVAIMTPKEREAVDKLDDEQIQKIAFDAKIDTGILAIFVNGYAINCKRVS